MEGKKGSKDDNKALSLNNWKDRAAIYSDVKVRMDLLKCFKIRRHALVILMRTILDAEWGRMAVGGMCVGEPVRRYL